MPGYLGDQFAIRMLADNNTKISSPALINSQHDIFVPSDITISFGTIFSPRIQIRHKGIKTKLYRVHPRAKCKRCRQSQAFDQKRMTDSHDFHPDYGPG